MSRIVFAFFALAFVQVVRSQSSECQDAISGLYGNDECLGLFEAANPSVCSGMCEVLLDTFQTACEDSRRGDPSINVIYAAIETICDSDANCTAALIAMNADTACADAIRNDNYTVECSGLCRTLITTALDTCPDNEYIQLRRNLFNQGCRSSSAGVLQASGIIALLLLAISALIA